MGRYAQYRKRGRGGPSPGEVLAPPANADWQIENDGGQILYTSLNAGPGHGVNGMGFEARDITAGGDYIEFQTIAVNSGADGPTIWVTGHTVGVRARWLIDAVPVSLYGPEQTLVIT